MILIADSGSTKTDWVLLDGYKKKQELTTQGFNPFFITSNYLTKELKATFSNNKTNAFVQYIYFYGAGCSADTQKEIIINGLNKVFNNAAIEVNSDLMGAARALFLNKQGIAVILGTGASTCLYDGLIIKDSIKSLGYIFGDEGGGDHIGKIFITKFLNNTLSTEITLKFSNQYNLSKDQILRKVYSEPFPNKFLASFCEFISENKKNHEMENIVKQSFRLLFEHYICKYNNYKNQEIRVTGSIGYIFENELRQVANEFSCNIDMIIKNPISKLIDFHTNNYL